MQRFICLLLLLLSATLPVTAAPPVLDPLFSDHMVCPRGTRFPVWGWAPPGTAVSLELLGQRVRAAATRDGRWEARLGPFAAHDATILKVTVGNTHVTVRDVLVGDVWLCSGQSNMELQVRSVNNGAGEIANANHPRLRLFHVPHAIANAPTTSLEARWEVCTPQTIGTFSAVGYFFGRDLQARLHVPIGLIESSWGGTPVEAWTSAGALARLTNLRADYPELLLEKLPRDQALKWEKDHLAAWWKANDPHSPAWGAETLDDAAWKTMNLPTVWEKAGMRGFDGVVWFRREVDVPADWAGHDLTLHLGPVDDRDLTFFNGAVVGSHDLWKDLRDYKIPATLVKAGRNVIAVRVLDTGGDGGFYGKPEQMHLDLDAEHTLPLGGPWRFKAACALTSRNPMPPHLIDNPNLASVLYNGMISPLVPFAIKGVIWYQGEANAARPETYRRLLATMIGDWRARFGPFPFLIVSLASFDADKTEKWPELREAQWQVTETVRDTAAVMAVDIGEAHDIHPKNKQEVGRRLSLAALARVYGQPVSWCGPVASTMRVRGNRVTVAFTHATGLHSSTPAVQGFELAGADHVFHPATATIQGTTVEITSPAVPHPIAVRYAWANDPRCTLYNGAGLPAVPFRRSR